MYELREWMIKVQSGRPWCNIYLISCPCLRHFCGYRPTGDARELKVMNGRIGLEVALSRQWKVMSVTDCSPSSSWGSQRFVLVLKDSEF